jgi:hypothetical protein
MNPKTRVERFLGKYGSRKLVATVATVALVAICDLMGAPLDQPTLDSITNLVLGLVGAQGLVDTTAAFRTGKALAKTADAAKDLVDDTDETKPPKRGKAP